MAERERLTKKERREQSRAERKRKEAEAQQKARRQRITSALITLLVLAGIGAIVYTALAGDDREVGDTIELVAAEVEEARAAAGCEVVDSGPLPDASHFDAASAPPADALYPGVRPTHSGPHFAVPHPAVAFSPDQLEERALTHNLEHGAVIVWYDPAQVDSGVRDDMRSWSNRLNNSGFEGQAGAALIVSAYDDPGISSGKAVAMRAWGIAMDCDEWDETAANAFVLDYFGTHGAAPERAAGPFPEEVLRYAEGDQPESTEAPTEDATDEPTDGATEGGTEEPTEDATG